LVASRIWSNTVDPRLSASDSDAFAALKSSLVVLYFLTLYFQDVRGYDALETGVGFCSRLASWSPAPRSLVGS
jgi:hypothetical protein